jgi:hypothetical protein
MNPPSYKRLSGRGRSWTGSSRLWLGPDHILAVYYQGYNETYKRFFFADVQAFVVRQTHTGKMWNGIWIMLAAVFGLFALSESGAAAMTLWCITAFFLFVLGINIAIGPTCICQVRTAV